MTSTNRQWLLAQSERRKRRRPVASMADLVEGQNLRGPKPRGFIVRFWESVRKAGDNECWEWIGPKFNTGYGSISIANTCHLAHRISFLIAHGRINPDGVIMHSCDNPSCVNPKHLSEGTDADNMHDAWLKGRMQKGERNGMAKLKESEAITIIQDYRNGIANMNQLAARYGVWPACIQRIIVGTRWKHLQSA